MINANMRLYNYFAYGEPDEYGQRTLIKDEGGAPAIQGTIKIAINNTSQSIQENIKYKGATYLGLTRDISVSDNYVIEYGKELLKVLYVTPGRLNQVFLSNI